MSRAVVENSINERIVEFLEGNRNFTLATSSGNIPYCANCFYAYEKYGNYLVFKSSETTKHIKQAKLNNRVAGSITPDTLDPGKIQGIQFSGLFLQTGTGIESSLKKIYYSKYPFALAFSGTIWAVKLTHIKMTDNTLGFGKKIEWSAKNQDENK